MKRRVAWLLTAIWAWPALAGAATPLPLELPPPDLAPLIPLAAPPLDKPPVPLPEVSVPDPPRALPVLPAPPLAADPSGKPVAPLSPPRLLACKPLGTVFGVASELLECGRARFQRDELEEARAALEGAVRGGGDRAVIREARDWLPETRPRSGPASWSPRKERPTSSPPTRPTRSGGWPSGSTTPPGRWGASTSSGVGLPFRASRRSWPVGGPAPPAGRGGSG